MKRWTLTRYAKPLDINFKGQIRGHYRFKWQAKRERNKYLIAQTVRGELWLIGPYSPLDFANSSD